MLGARIKVFRWREGRHSEHSLVPWIREADSPFRALSFRRSAARENGREPKPGICPAGQGQGHERVQILKRIHASLTARRQIQFHLYGSDPRRHRLSPALQQVLRPIAYLPRTSPTKSRLSSQSRSRSSYYCISIVAPREIQTWITRTESMSLTNDY